ncbi:MAG: hypothetical protein CR993_07275 [Rhodobacterales bacterium]|nr:MAG: hypothetical protein CR993_07275 [Rhodobacterales bacterium]
MFRFGLCVLAALVAFSFPVMAQERTTLGVGRLFVNDAMGDGQDRWRTGAHTISVMRGPEGMQSRPGQYGVLMEYRFANRIMAPSNLVSPAVWDRRYAGMLSFGAYSHFARDGFEYTVGSEFVAVGPMTGLGRFQSAVHDLIGMEAPGAGTLANQIPNAIYPTLAFEIAKPFPIGNAVLRPFLQGRAGDETYLRAGADLLIGSNFTTGILVRDETTGVLYQTLEDVPQTGLSFLLGGDVAKVFHSAYLPASDGYALTPLRYRLRAGLHYQGEKAGVFYGLTWLGREFTAQPEGQLVGALQVQFHF